MLTMEPVVKVNVSVELTTTVQSVFDVGAIVGPSTVIDATTRFKVFSSLAAMLDPIAGGFSTTSPEYIYAAKYFGTSPAPASLVVIHYETDPEADPYDSTHTYNVGDYCTHEGDLYQCNTASTTGTWDSTKWDEVTRTDETPATALADAVEKGAEFYGVVYCPTESASAAEIKTTLIGINGFMNSRNFGMLFYGATGTAQELVSNDGLFKTFSEAGAKRAIGMACTSDASDAAGLMGLAMGMTRTHTGSAYALAYKSIATATTNNLSEDNVTAIKAINGNVYVARTKTRASIENGATGSGMRYDEVLYLDMIVADLQTACFNLIANSDIKLPQNDTTTALFKSAIGRVLEGYYNRGVLSSMEWRSQPKGNVQTGDLVEHGYYMFANRYDEQSDEDRAARKAVPITILLCLSGAVESIELNLFVQR